MLSQAVVSNRRPLAAPDGLPGRMWRREKRLHPWAGGEERLVKGTSSAKLLSPVQCLNTNSPQLMALVYTHEFASGTNINILPIARLQRRVKPRRSCHRLCVS